MGATARRNVLPHVYISALNYDTSNIYGNLFRVQNLYYRIRYNCIFIERTYILLTALVGQLPLFPSKWIKALVRKRMDFLNVRSKATENAENIPTYDAFFFVGVAGRRALLCPKDHGRANWLGLPEWVGLSDKELAVGQLIKSNVLFSPRTLRKAILPGRMYMHAHIIAHRRNRFFLYDGHRT